MPKADKQLEEKALQGASAEVVQRYGSAVKEHVVAYTGNDAGEKLSKGLKTISNNKVSEQFGEANIKQQAGFSAEVKSVARKNAENIINGDDARFIRKDDIASAANDQIVDISMLDKMGNEILQSGSQMKFVGKDSSDLLDKLRSPKFHKYIENNVFLDVADDNYYELAGVNGNPGLIDEEITKLKHQLDRAAQKGDEELVRQKQNQIQDCEHIKKKLRRSGLTCSEALEARCHPLMSTAKDIAKVANRAGIEQAKTGAVISGSISIVKNLVLCYKGGIDPKDAAVQVVKDTGTGAAFSYATAFAGSMAKGAMQNASSSYIRGLANTNLASGLVSTTVNIGKTMAKFIGGKISLAECVDQLGEKGFGEIGAATYATIASAAVSGTSSALIQIAVGMVGSTVGYMAAVAVYQELSTSLKEYELAKEKRVRIEAECAEAVALAVQYRQEMNQIVEKYLAEHNEAFLVGLDAMDSAVAASDSNGFIAANNEIQKALGKEVQFTSQSEFDDLMESDETFKL